VGHHGRAGGTSSCRNSCWPTLGSG
jgi:hypothetical protein